MPSNVKATPHEARGVGWWIVLAVVLCISGSTFAVWRILGSPLIGCDDANIFFIYARNFAHGNGIVYNPGGQHVEGFSSILYFLLCTLAYLLSGKPEIGLFWLNFLFCLLTTVTLAILIRRFAGAYRLPLTQTTLLILAYLLWLAINPSYFAWNTVSLMDVGLYTFAITLAYAFLAFLILRETAPRKIEELHLSLLAILLLLTRPEGIAWALVAIAAFGIIVWLTSDSLPRALKSITTPVLALLLAEAAVELFRFKYFGYLLPNTFYAKVSASLGQTLQDGSRYLVAFIRLYGVLSILPLLLVTGGVAFLIMRRKPLDVPTRVTLLTLLFAAAGLAIPVLEGGDHFRDFRMYQSIYPILGIVFLLPAVYLLRSRQWTGGLGYFAAMLVLGTLTWRGSWAEFSEGNQLQATPDTLMRVRVEFLIATQGRQRGDRLNHLFANQLPSIGVFEAGGNAYAYNGATYDLMGLNDPRMAHADKIKSGPKGHQSFNKDVFYSLAPDILLPEVHSSSQSLDLNAIDPIYRNPDGFENQAFKNIFADPQFNAAYSLVAIRNVSLPGFVCYGYFKNTFLATLTASGQYVVLARLHPAFSPAA